VRGYQEIGFEIKRKRQEVKRLIQTKPIAMQHGEFIKKKN
jgi:hypothetical protein